MWYVTNQKQGVNALGLQRLLGLGSYHTAWTWLHKLRRAMVRPGRDRLAGTVEVDETFLGGPQPGKRGRGAAGKVLVLVAAQEDGPRIGRIRLRRIADASGPTLEAAIQSMIAPGAPCAPTLGAATTACRLADTPTRLSDRKPPLETISCLWLIASRLC